MSSLIIEVNFLNDLPEAAKAIWDFVEKETVLIFEGEMAAGKTTLIKEICRQLGVTEAVSSPTFALVNEYETLQKKTVYHFDFYRIKNEQEALDMGVFDYLDSGNICLIEWPENIKNLLPDQLVEVIIEKGNGEARTITLKRS